MQVQILNAATTTSSVPSVATDGFDMKTFRKHEDDVLFALHSTAGSAVMSCSVRLWGYCSTLAKWYPMGIGTDALKGVVNGGNSMGEVATDTILHCERVSGIKEFDRVYAQVTAIGGTNTAISAYLLSRGA